MIEIKNYIVYIVLPQGKRFLNSRCFSRQEEAEEVKKHAEQALKDTPCWVEIEELEV